VDFLEDASLNLLIALALGWSDLRRARVGIALAGILLIPALATFWAAWNRLMDGVPPPAIPLTLTGTGALVVNLSCAVLLARYRESSGSLTRAAFLSARNDVLANIAIIAAGLLTAYTRLVWPDLAVGLGIGALNADAARQVWRAAQTERAAAGSDET